MNRKLASHIQYNWISYVLIAVIVIALWCVVFDAVSQPKDNEKISIIFYSTGWDSYDLTLHLNSNREKISSQYLKKITTEQVSASKATLFQRLGTDMITNDIVVIEQSLLEHGDETKYDLNPDEVFYAINLEKVSSVFGDMDINYLMVDGKAYGIYLNAPNDGKTNNFEKYYKGDDIFILFFSRESVNVNQMNELGRKGDCAAIEVVKYLLEISDETI